MKNLITIVLFGLALCMFSCQDESGEIVPHDDIQMEGSQGHIASESQWVAA